MILASIECTPHLGGPTSQKAALEFRAKSSDSDRNRVPGLQLSANYLPSRRLGVTVPTGISSKAHVFSHSHTHCHPPPSCRMCFPSYWAGESQLGNIAGLAWSICLPCLTSATTDTMSRDVRSLWFRVNGNPQRPHQLSEKGKCRVPELHLTLSTCIP